MVRLSPDQEAAEKKVCQWLFETKSPFFALGGLAGTGKSTLAGVLASRFRESGVLTAFAAPFGKAASILRSKGMPAHTLCSLLYRVAGTYMDDNGNECPAFVDKPWSESCDLLVVDEASTVSTKLFNDIRARDIRTLFLGDHGQLKPVGGDPKIMDRAAVRLEKIHRQAEHSEILLAAHAARVGKPLPKPKTDSLRIGKIRSLDHAVTVAKREGADQTIVATNRERSEFNYLYRKRDGVADSPPVEGEQVCCLYNNRNEDIWNGQTYRVDRVREVLCDTVILDLHCTDDGSKRFKVPCFRQGFGGADFERPEYLQNGNNLFAYGYAMTCHKMQGSQAGHVMVIDNPTADPERWRYTGYTRAENILTIAKYL